MQKITFWLVRFREWVELLVGLVLILILFQWIAAEERFEMRRLRPLREVEP